jgi:putative chitinase
LNVVDNVSKGFRRDTGQREGDGMGKINRTFFYARLHGRLYQHGLDQSRIAGHDVILDEWENNHAHADDRWLAYILATAHHEAGSEMQPVRENLNYSAEGLLETFPKYFNAADAGRYAHQPQKIANRAYANRMGNGSENSGDGWLYRGRGLVQITGRANYAKYDLADNPDAALAPATAVRILFDGMIKGSFTGKKLADYFNSTTADWTGARSIINPGDHGDKIGSDGRAYHAAIGYGGSGPAIDNLLQI